jgi:hypothetical protein
MPDRLEERVNPHEMQLCFDGSKRRHLRLAALIHAVDVWDQIELIDLSAKRSDHGQNGLLPGRYRAGPPAGDMMHLQLISETGEVLTGYALVQELTRTLRLLWPLALITWIPGRASKVTR